jgi:hypothetical protein
MTAAYDPAAAPWRTWGSGVVCATTADGEDAGVIGILNSTGLAEAACADHNALLDLTWLAEAGFDVELSRRPGNPYRNGNPWRAELSPAPDGWTATCGQGASPSEALAKAREWAEGRVT